MGTLDNPSIVQRLERANHVHYLVDFEFPGKTFRMATKTIPLKADLERIVDQLIFTDAGANFGTTSAEYIASQFQMPQVHDQVEFISTYIQKTYYNFSDYKALIWDNDTASGGQPGTVIAETASYPCIGVTHRGYGLVNLPLLEPIVLTPGQLYWFGMYQDYLTSGHFMGVSINQAGPYNANLTKRHDGSVWNLYSNLTEISFALSKPGGAYIYNGLLESLGGIGTTFDIRNFTHSVGNLSGKIINKERFQDQEVFNTLDGSKCVVRLWCEGLKWSDIEKDGVLYTGLFQKESHNKYEYNFKIESAGRLGMKTVPGNYISNETFPDHRKISGSGSVSGIEIPLIFGRFEKGIPLLCTDTTLFHYAVCTGLPKSVDADYTAGDVEVVDKDGTTISAALYTYYVGVAPGGIPYGYFDFTADQKNNEKLTCAIDGYYDADGSIAGTAGLLIEHPVDIIQYLVENFGYSMGVVGDSFSKAKAILTGMRFAVYCNSTTNGLDLIKRIATQCQMSVIEKNNSLELVCFDFTANPLKYFNSGDAALNNPSFSKTERNNICNQLTINYGLNVGTGQYEGQLRLNKDNNSLCQKSFDEFGEMPELVLTLPDIRTEEMARIVANRYLAVNALRHDVVEIDMPFHMAHHLNEGDCHAWTLPDGPSFDGKGFIDEYMILLEKNYVERAIQTRWWRIKIDVTYGGTYLQTLGYIRDQDGGYIFDHTGSGIRDHTWRNDN